MELKKWLHFQHKVKKEQEKNSMTQRETERLAIVEANQKNMSDNLEEIKQDIKELKSMMYDVRQNYITKNTARWIAGVIISVFTAFIYVWDVILRGGK